MKLRHAALAAPALALLLTAPLPMGAEAHGHGAHGFHFSGRLHASRPYGYGRYGGYGAYYAPFYSGGIVAVPPYAPANAVNYVLPPRVIYVPEPPRALTCHRSRETVTVPTDTGGTRQITVTRC